MSDPLKPELSVLVKLGSIAVHIEEMLETGHEFDLAAVRGLLSDPTVREWREQMDALALLPVKRNAEWRHRADRRLVVPALPGPLGEDRDALLRPEPSDAGALVAGGAAVSRLRTLAMNAQAGAAQIGKRLGPGDDWNPVLFLQSYDDEVTIAGVAPSLLDSDEAKDLLAAALFSQIFASVAVRVVFLTSAWMTRVDSREEAEAAPRPSEHPDREEMLFMVGADFDEMLSWSAPIRRLSDETPRLGPWRELPAEAFLEGRFVDPLRAALGMQRQLAEEPIAFLERMSERDDLSVAAREAMAEFAEVGRSDPEAAEHMPIRQWWLGQLAQRRGAA